MNKCFNDGVREGKAFNKFIAGVRRRWTKRKHKRAEMVSVAAGIASTMPAVVEKLTELMAMADQVELEHLGPGERAAFARSFVRFMKAVLRELHKNAPKAKRRAKKSQRQPQRVDHRQPQR